MLEEGDLRKQQGSRARRNHEVPWRGAAVGRCRRVASRGQVLRPLGPPLPWSLWKIAFVLEFSMLSLKPFMSITVMVRSMIGSSSDWRGGRPRFLRSTASAAGILILIWSSCMMIQYLWAGGVRRDGGGPM